MVVISIKNIKNKDGLQNTKDKASIQQMDKLNLMQNAEK